MDKDLARRHLDLERHWQEAQERQEGEQTNPGPVPPKPPAAVPARVLKPAIADLEVGEEDEWEWDDELDDGELGEDELDEDEWESDEDEDFADEDEEPKRTPDPFADAKNARWEEFEAADYEGRIALFTKTLDEPDLMDGDMAVEMLDNLELDARHRHEEPRYEGLIQLLRQRRPEAYASNAAYFLHDLLMQRIAAGRLEETGPLARELAAHAAEDVDILFLAITPLAYHGQLAALVEVMRIGWPQVKESPEILGHAKEEFFERAVRFEMLLYCQETAAPRADDPELLRRLESYGEPIGPEYVAEFIGHVSGQTPLAPMPGIAEAAAARQSHADDEPLNPRAIWCELRGLELTGYLHRQEGVPLAKADLAAHGLAQYLIERLTERHPNGLPLYDPGQRPKARKGKARHKVRRAVHVLCPDPRSLERYLARQLRFASSAPHLAAATMEAIPGWLRFLRSRQLIDGNEQAQTLDALVPVQKEMRELWRTYDDDPALREAAETALRPPP